MTFSQFPSHFCVPCKSLLPSGLVMKTASLCLCTLFKSLIRQLHSEQSVNGLTFDPCSFSSDSAGVGANKELVHKISDNEGFLLMLSKQAISPSLSSWLFTEIQRNWQKSSNILQSRWRIFMMLVFCFVGGKADM